MPATKLRADLAAAIERVAQLAAERDELQLAAFHLPDGVIDLQEEAEEQLKLARQRERQPAVVLARARGQHVDGPTIAEAEAALAAANDAVAQAQANCRAIAAVVPGAEAALDLATARRDELIGQIIAKTPEVAALLAEFDAVRARAATLEAALGPLARGLPMNWNYIKQFEPDAIAVAAVKDWRKALATSAAALFPTSTPPAPEQAEAA